MSFPPNLIYPGDHDYEWLLDCSRCTKVEIFNHDYFHKVLGDVEDSDWEVIDGDAVCPLCVEESHKNKSK